MEKQEQNSVKQRTIGSRIAILNRMDRGFFAKRLKHYSLGSSEMAVLMQISYFGELSQDQVASNIMMDKASISKIVKKLLQKGYIYVARDTEDNRIHRLGLTLKGKEILPVLKDSTKEWLNILTTGFSAEEIDKVCCIMDKMIQNVARLE